VLPKRLWSRVVAFRLGLLAVPRDTRIAVVVAAWIFVALVAYLVASAIWHEHLSRQAIAVGALLAIAAVTFFFFGFGGAKAIAAGLAFLTPLVLFGGGTLRADALLPEGPAPRGALVGCPPLPDEDEYEFDGQIAATDFPYAHLRAATEFGAQILARYPADCELGFKGYCIGEPARDWRFDAPDPIWFVHAGKDGYIASADVKASPPPPRLLEENCHGSRPPPNRPEITSPVGKRISGRVEITAAVPHAAIVGFAVYYEEVPGRPTTADWHRIDLDVDTADGIAAAWESRSVPGQSKTTPAPVTLAAVPCLGLEFPAEDLDTRAYLVANRGGSGDRSLTPPPWTLEDARVLACENEER
jgi:hypothetical protein